MTRAEHDQPILDFLIPISESIAFRREDFGPLATIAKSKGLFSGRKATYAEESLLGCWRRYLKKERKNTLPAKKGDDCKRQT